MDQKKTRGGLRHNSSEMWLFKEERTFNCEWCGTEVRSTESHARFCSPYHRLRAFQIKNRLESAEVFQKTFFSRTGTTESVKAKFGIWLKGIKKIGNKGFEATIHARNGNKMKVVLASEEGRVLLYPSANKDKDGIHYTLGQVGISALEYFASNDPELHTHAVKKLKDQPEEAARRAIEYAALSLFTQSGIETKLKSQLKKSIFFTKTNSYQVYESKFKPCSDALGWIKRHQREDYLLLNELPWEEQFTLLTAG